MRTGIGVLLKWQFENKILIISIILITVKTIHIKAYLDSMIQQRKKSKYNKDGYRICITIIIKIHFKITSKSIWNDIEQVDVIRQAINERYGIPFWICL